jgi:hypothetical protein
MRVYYAGHRYTYNYCCTFLGLNNNKDFDEDANLKS